MKLINCKEFVNGKVYLFTLKDGFPIEVTDTFLPFYTKNVIGRKQNKLDNKNIGSRMERWMIGVSTMSGCPVKCKFCAAGELKKWRSLTEEEIIEQILTLIKYNIADYHPNNAKEFKINYTRMGEPFLNIEAVKTTIKRISKIFPNTHHYISTIGIKDSDFSWIEGNVTLQISLHSLNERRRNWLIPYSKKMTLEELGKIRTKSNLKTTINLTLVDNFDFNIDILKKYFDPDYFKLSPNPNEISEKNNLGKGIIKGVNLL